MIIKTVAKKIFFVFFIGTFLTLNSSGQIFINEICPANVSIIANSDGQFDDWIEVYNAGTSKINLNGYCLTDDSSSLQRCFEPLWFLLRYHLKHATVLFFHRYDYPSKHLFLIEYDCW